MSLAVAVARCRYRDWTFRFANEGALLQVVAPVVDSGTALPRTITHSFVVPAEHPDWSRWLLERVIDVETHEAMEYFYEDDDRPFMPSHQGGGDFYAVVRASDRW